MPWITVADAKANLNKSGTRVDDDDELAGFVDAACAAIEDIMGHVDLIPVTESHRAQRVSQSGPRWFSYLRTRFIIVLRETPVDSITSVSWVSGGTSTDIPASTDPSDPFVGWTAVENALHVPHWGEYTISYTAGRSIIPPNYTLAALELVNHLWRGSQLNQSSGRPALGGDQMQVVPRMASAMPYRVRELLGLYGEVVNNYPVIA